MELDAKTRLRRFCYLGTQEPVYVYLRGSVKIAELWPQIATLCTALNDGEFMHIMRELLQQTKLVRRDETLFVYAVYLASDVDWRWKTTVRTAFALCIRNDDDLFLFCKYAMGIQKLRQRKGFSKTVRKAISAWYELQSPASIQNMFLHHRGAHGFTHKALLKMCHVSDDTIGQGGVVSTFFNTCSELLKMSQAEKRNNSDEQAAMEPNGNSITASAAAVAAAATTTTPPPPPQNATETTASNVAEEQATNSTNPTANEAANAKSKPKSKQLPKEKSFKNSFSLSAPVIAMSRLRTTKSPSEALKIIKQYKLDYSQVPGHLLKHAPILESVIPTMSYFQLLKSWKQMGRKNLFDNPKILELCKKMLENRNILRKHNIHPVVLLIKLNELGVREDTTKLAPKKVKAWRMNYLRDIYMQSFGHNQGTGLRMHITINLQKNYKKKLLVNHKKLSYIEAAVALAFGYYKKDSNVNVFRWGDHKTMLEPIPWTKEMGIKEAKDICEKVENAKNTQRLVLPLMNSLAQKDIYDLFIAIVPTAGRGNPQQKSEFLCKFLDKYRDTKNARAKYVIVNLRKFKRSMAYSTERKENILEICGLDEHTTDLINNFALNRFG